MIESLLESAASLEQYAREAERSCAQMVYFLSWSFNAYDMVAPVYPKPIPLSAYPLDFIAPEGMSLVKT